MTAESTLLFEKHDGIAWLTLNRPAVHNAVNLAMRDELWTALHAVRDDPDVRVAVFRGAGDRAFSAGADISEFGTAPSIVEARAARAQRDTWGLMLSLDKPLIAALHGYAYGAGLELALCCDLRIASEDATFALPEVKLGYIPSAGGTQLLPRTIPPGVARELIFAGEPIDAKRALALRLVSRVVPRGRLYDEAAALAAHIAALPQAAVRGARDAIRRGADLPLDDALRLEQMVAAHVAGQPA